MRSASLALYAGTMDFCALHALTGCHWLRLIEPLTPDFGLALRYFWQAIGALYPKIGFPDLPKPEPQMLQIAEKIVEQQSGEFDPSEFTDRYEDALRELIEKKRKGKPVKPATRPANDDTKVVDLMAALKKSLGAAAERRPAAAAKKKPGGRRAA